MYKKGIYKILANEPLTATVWRMVLGGDTQWITAPGQFVDIALEGRYLRRPISVCDYDATTLTLIYKVVGEGTAQMSRMAAGGELDLLTGLGNGFDVHNAAQRPLLVGGGVGVPPLYNLAKVLLAGRCRCCGHCATLCRRTGSSRSKSAWAAVSGPAWAVRAKPNTATSASARRGPY